MQNIYSFHYNSCDDAKTKIVYYQTGIQLATMHFLNYVQDDGNLLQLMSDESKEEFNDIKDIYLNEKVFEDSFEASVIFIQHASPRLVDEFDQMLIGLEDTSIETKELDSLIEKRGHLIKQITVCDSRYSDLDSYCTTEGRVAYLLRSKQDGRGVRKTWLKNSDIYFVIRELNKRTYSTISEFYSAVCEIADVLVISYSNLFLMVTSLMAHYTVKCCYDQRMEPIGSLIKSSLMFILNEKEI